MLLSYDDCYEKCLVLFVLGKQTLQAFRYGSVAVTFQIF